MAGLRIHICSLICYATFLNLISCYSLPENHVAFFIFGDSLFGAGNNNYINTTLNYQANFWPYGETCFKYPTGRVSDGRIIPDLLVIDLNTQVSNFKIIEKLLRQESGDAEAKRVLGRALYIFSIGSNDYFAPTAENSSALQSYSKGEYVATVIGNLTVSIKEIHKKGGKKSGFLSLPPFGFWVNKKQN